MDNVFLYKNSFLLHENVKSTMYFGGYSKCPQPRISIILPVYNRPQTLEKALLSAINQEGFKDYEIVVVDNNENHPSPNLEVVKRLSSDSINVFYYQHDENIGMYGNFNRGIQLARGEFVTFCHDDDYLLPNALAVLSSVCHILNHGECLIADHMTVDENDSVLSECSVRAIPFFKKKKFYKYSKFDMFIRGAGIGGGGCLFNKDKLIELGGFREDLYPGSDYALFINYQKAYGCYFLTIPTYCYRKAENESIKVYSQFPLLNMFFMDCMKPYLFCPDFILNLIIKAKYKTSVVSLGREWGNNNNHSGNGIWFYSFLNTFLRGVTKIKAFTI